MFEIKNTFHKRSVKTKYSLVDILISRREGKSKYESKERNNLISSSMRIINKLCGSDTCSCIGAGALIEINLNTMEILSSDDC